MTDEPRIRGSWPLAIERDGRVLWHVAGTNPPRYAPDDKLEAIYMAAQQKLKAPFPYFGGKSKIADLVWERFGAVDNYVEPFFGSGAVLLGCPHPGHTETVNDADGLLANFWRAVAYDAEAVAQHCDWPVNECDLHAWHKALVASRPRITDQLMADPKFYDAELAGRWVWGISQWIGTGWCPQPPEENAFDHKVCTKDGELWQTRPHLSDNRGVVSLSGQLPMLHGDSGASGRGVSSERLAHSRPSIGGTGDRTHKGRGGHRAQLARKMPFIASPSPDRKQHGLGVHGRRLSQKMPEVGSARGVAAGAYEPIGALYTYFAALQSRLRRTRVVCGDFARILGPSVTWRHGMTAVFLDPPYADDEHAVTYSGGGRVWERVCAWCEENGDHPLMRIALCGYADTWQTPAGWTAIRWRTSGGYGSQGNARGRENANRECVWFSPACLDPAELARDALSRPISVGESSFVGTLFDESEAA